MDTDRTTYEKAVRDHLARRRQAMPIVPRDALSPLAEGPGHHGLLGLIAVVPFPRPVVSTAA